MKRANEPTEARHESWGCEKRMEQFHRIDRPDFSKQRMLATTKNKNKKKKNSPGDPQERSIYR